VNNKIRGFSKVINDIIQLTESLNFVTGIVKEALDILGITELFNKIRVVFTSNNVGIFTSTTNTNINDMLSLSSIDIDDLIVIDSLNSGDMKIIDDD
jgi:hypothetical protein